MGELKVFTGFFTDQEALAAAAAINNLLGEAARYRSDNARRAEVRMYRNGAPDLGYEIWMVEPDRTIDQIRHGIIYDLLLAGIVCVHKNHCVI
jgi:hypothetical protein